MVMMNRRALLSAAAAAPLAAGAARAQAATLKVGCTPSGVPFTFLDTKRNSIEGVMVDIVRAVGKEAGFDRLAEPVSPGGVPQQRLSGIKCTDDMAGRRRQKRGKRCELRREGALLFGINLRPIS